MHTCIHAYQAIPYHTTPYIHTYRQATCIYTYIQAYRAGQDRAIQVRACKGRGKKGQGTTGQPRAGHKRAGHTYMQPDTGKSTPIHTIIHTGRQDDRQANTHTGRKA